MLLCIYSLPLICYARSLSLSLDFDSLCLPFRISGSFLVSFCAVVYC